MNLSTLLLAQAVHNMDGRMPLWVSVPLLILCGVGLVIVGRSLLNDYRGKRK